MHAARKMATKTLFMAGPVIVRPNISKGPRCRHRMRFASSAPRHYFVSHSSLSSCRAVLGIDIGGSGIKGALVNTSTGSLKGDRHRIATPRPAKPDQVAVVVRKLVRHFNWKGTLGIALPARVKSGVAMTAANIDDSWIGTDAAKLFRKSTGCEAVVLNDADAAGLAEMTFGAGRGTSGVALVLTFGTGIGSALFVDGRLVPNTEFGHLELHGGIAEAYAASSARKRQQLTWEDWARRAQEYLDHVEFVFAPDLIVIGGGISRPKRARKYLHLLSTKARLVPARLQNEAGIVGAACAAHRAGSDGRLKL